MEIKLKDEKENQSRQNQSSFEETMQVKLELKDENLESTQSRQKVENQNRCTICDSTFSLKSNLKIHLTTVHENSDEFKCDICRRTFEHECSLHNHVKTTHGSMNAVGCKSCGKSFKLKSSLKRHVETLHVNMNSYKCKLCDKNFTWKSP